MSILLSRRVRVNLAWFALSWLLALMIWLLAANSADPISQVSFTNLPIAVRVDEGILVTNRPTSTGRVLVTGRSSQISLLTSEDIVLVANATSLAAGTHNVSIEASVARSGIIEIDRQPTQIRLTLEQAIAEQKPLKINITKSLPADYANDAPQSEVLQVRVSGTETSVARVVEVRADLDLSAERAPIQAEATLYAVDANGLRINDVELEPREATLNVNIYARDNVRQVSVRPDLLLDTLPAGYVLTTISYEPQIVYVSASASELARLSNTLNTEPISLANQTEPFTFTAALNLPSGLLVVGEETVIRVSIGIAAQTSTRQFSDVPVQLAGLPSNYSASLTPDSVTLVINGPIALVDSIRADELQAILDLSSVTPGTYELSPRILIRSGEIALETSSLPAQISVSISAPTAEATPEATRAP